MELEIRIPNDGRALPAARAFLDEALDAVGKLGAKPDAAAFLDFVVRAVETAVEGAYPQGETGTVEVHVEPSAGKLIATVRDRGLPQDLDALERRLHARDDTAQPMFGVACEDVADEVHWIGYGPEGKALRVVKRLDDAHVETHLEEDKLTAFEEDAEQAPEQEYVIRRITPDEAVRVSQVMYRAYGGSYFNADVYYPERVAAANEHGTTISFVAQAEDGSFAGHFALERNQTGPVAEIGQAVVDPAHRGRGLLSKMRKGVVAEARRLGLVGLYGDTVAVHPWTQKAELHHGGHLSCVDLGISPAGEHFRGIAETLTQRVTCLLYFIWLEDPVSRRVFAPSAHREWTRALYENLACPASFDEGRAPRGHGKLTVSMEGGAARAFVRVDKIGEDTVAHVACARRELVEHARTEVVYAELPLSDPGTPGVAEALESEGFAFAGIAPHFAPGGDLLRLVYLVEPLGREPIVTYEPLAGRLVDYALGEQARVRAALDANALGKHA